MENNKIEQPCSHHVCVLSHFSHVRLFATLWPLVLQAPLSVGFSRQEYWSGLPCPPPGALPTQGLNPPLTSPTLAGKFFTTSAIGKAHIGRSHLVILTHFTFYSISYFFKEIKHELGTQF